MNFRHVLLSSLVCVCCVSNDVLAQKKVASDPWTVVKTWDKNKDGILQQSEIPEAARSKVAGAAKSRGLDPDQPLKIEVLLGKADGTGNKPFGAFSKNATKNAQSKSKKTEKDEHKAVETDAAEQQSKRKAKNGFGKTNTKKAAAGFGREQQDSNAAGKEAETNEKLLGMARALLYQYDKNKNGRLEKNEWGRLKGNPGESDADKDGVLTTEELAEHLGGYGRREKDVTARSRGRNSRSATKKSSDKKSYRFLTPHDRLPDGLPGWFTEKDENGDGQLSMKEYVGSISAAKVKKFMQFDLNKDGMLVAKEYLAATK